MHARAAVLREVPGKWQIVDVEVDEPKAREVLVRMVATGLCHSDDHFACGDLRPENFPFCGGHESTGIIEAVGPGVTSLKPGDHIVTQFLPSCGHCRWCASGRQNLCDLGAMMLTGTMLDGTFRTHLDGEGVAQVGGIGGFSELAVMHEWTCIKLAPDVPLDLAALLGCAIPTGWGSAVNAAQVAPGDVVIIMGAGGIGLSAVQGAVHAGATHVIVVDPVEFKREVALTLGATQAFDNINEATDAARSRTNGQGADSAIITVGVLRPQDITDAVSAIRKGGTVALTSVGSGEMESVLLPLLEITMYQKRIQGSLCGMMSPAKDVPRLLSMWEAGQLRLEEMLTRAYPLEQINEGYDDLKAGRNIRGIIRFPGADIAGQSAVITKRGQFDRPAAVN